MRILVATAVMVTAGASQRGDMSDEEEVTYPIDDVLAALQHAEHRPILTSPAALSNQPPQGVTNPS